MYKPKKNRERAEIREGILYEITFIGSDSIYEMW